MSTVQWKLDQGARGVLVESIQRAVGHPITGVLGDSTRAAVVRRGYKVVTNASWPLIVRQPVPTTSQIILSFLSGLDGRSWGSTRGNIGGSGASFGFLPFDMRSGAMTDVLRRVPRSSLIKHIPERMADELRALHDAMPIDRVRWGVAASSPLQPSQMFGAWSERFGVLGGLPTVREAQWAVGLEMLGRAEALAHSYAIPCDASQHARLVALLLDMRLTEQKPDFSPPRSASIDNALVELARRGPDALRSRRMTIATGRGTISGHTYNLDACGFPCPTPKN